MTRLTLFMFIGYYDISCRSPGLVLRFTVLLAQFYILFD
jgi:hypothetical protein